ncbi:MAG: hypothetical protein ABI702_15955 [Burkholderiales bacterium]
MSKPVRSLLWPAQTPALTAGVVLGWLVWELARVPDQPLFHLAMGLILVGSGGASFVLYSLHRQSRDPRVTRSAVAREARDCATWLSCGILLALHAMPAVLA